MAAVDQDILGGGLDIEGWSYIKKDVATKINDMTDRTTVLRNTFPMQIRSKLQAEVAARVHEIITTALEAKSVIDVPFIGKFLLLIYLLEMNTYSFYVQFNNLQSNLPNYTKLLYFSRKTKARSRCCIWSPVACYCRRVI